MALTKTEKISKLKQWLNLTKLDPKVTQATLGMAADSINPQLLLASSAKLIKVNKGEAKPDDRDDLRYSAFHGIEDMIDEHVRRDAGKIQQKAAYKMQMKKNLSWLTPGFFSPQIRSCVIGNPLAVNTEGINPMQLMDDSNKITKMGPGGIPCYDELTEVLTLVGFKFWKDVTESDFFACLVDNHFDYHKARRLHKYSYKGLMYRLLTQDLDYLVTPDHSCYISVKHMDSNAAWSAFTFVLAKYVNKLPDYLSVRFKRDLKGEVSEITDPKTAFSEEQYDGAVYCAEVPGHLLFVRRNGKTMWSGNSTDAIPDESRNVSPSSFGFFDPLHISENLNIGVTNYVNHNVGKGDDNKLYRIMKDSKGNLKWMDHEQILNHQILIPEY